MPYTAEQLKSATDRHIDRDEELKELLRQVLMQKKRHWLVDLVSDVARGVFGNVIGSVVERVVDWFFTRWLAPSSSSSSSSSSSNNSGDCFVATVVYGSPDAFEVRALRHFRDNRLSKAYAGRCFIRAYYSILGPAAARIITRLGGPTRLLTKLALDRFVSGYVKKSKL